MKLVQLLFSNLFTALVFGSVFGAANAEVYMNLGNSLFTTAQILGANKDQSRDRYIILNGTPITTNSFKIKVEHEDAIYEIYKNKVNVSELDEVNESKLPGIGSEPIVVVNDEWSAIFNINSDGLSDNQESMNLQLIPNVNSENYIILVRNSANNNSIVHELKFNQAKDMRDLLFKQDDDVLCNEKLNIHRYPSSRRKFCMTELTNEKIISQVIIYEGFGDPVTRISHYQDELVNLEYKLDSVDKSSSDQAILFASNKYSNITVFTYRSENKILDVIQSHF